MAGKHKNKPTTETSRRKKRRRSAQSRSSPAKRSTNGKVAVAVLNSERLKELYSTMLKCHLLQEKMQALLFEKKPGQAIAAIAGREAIMVGAIAHLVAEDSITLAQGGWVASYIKGTPLKSIVAQLLKSRTNPPGYSPAGQNQPVSSARLSIAKGLKLADGVKEKARVAMVFPGHDETAQAFLHDALAVAAKYKQPFVCLIETRLSPELVAPRQHSQHDPGTTTPECHYPRITVDGADVVAIFRVAQEAVRRARAGHGPCLIECVMPAEAAAQSESRGAVHNPLVFMEQYLRHRNRWSDEWRQRIIDDFGKEMEEAIASAGESAGSEVPFDHVYAADGVSARLELVASLPS
jgi:TPP-dependent pyruvate/acetoin dehydrogenase alpha subunit